MIHVTHLSKRYQNHLVLNDVSFELPRYGLVVILGPSGCGKTTLLKCLAGLTSFEGDINFQGTSLQKLNEKSRADFRLENIGFVFQDYQLYEQETVEKNILLPLESKYLVSKSLKERKIRDLLSVVDLKIKPNTIVNRLSGGQKQRVALARSLVNSPHLVLADEPTGNLDEENSRKVMEILHRVSTTSLVLMVSHNESLSQEYANQIIRIQDGKILQNYPVRPCQHHEYIPVIETNHQPKKISLPFSFLFSHAFHLAKEKKGRTLMNYLITSLGLVGVGLAFTLSSSLSGYIKTAYASFIDEDSLFVHSDLASSVSKRCGASYEELLALKKDYPDFIEDIGIDYIADFESFFTDGNGVYLSNGTYQAKINDLSARSFNEYLFLNDEEVYPGPIISLDDDELILGLTYPEIERLCQKWKITPGVKSLSGYFTEHEITLCLTTENDSWQYSDEHLFMVRGFVLSSSNMIYHIHPLWNEYVFEELMRFPTSDSLLEKDETPWVMKKIYYLKIQDMDAFLLLSKKDSRFSSFLFELPSDRYYYLLPEEEKETRLLSFFNDTNEIPYALRAYIEKSDSGFSSPVYGSGKGIGIYPSQLLMGFASETYFASDLSLLEKCIDDHSFLDDVDLSTVELPDGVKSGFYITSKSKGVRFTSERTPYLGRSAITLSEILVSSALAKNLFGREDCTFQTLYLANLTSSFQKEDGETVNEFSIVPLTITGIFSSPNMEISHAPEWSIAFFQKMLGYSVFDLGISVISFSYSGNADDQTLAAFKENFPHYSLMNPFHQVNQSVEEISGKIKIALLAISLIASVSSVLLIVSSLYLFSVENEKDLFLAYELGLNRRETRKFIYAQGFVLVGFSLLFSFIELIVLSVLISFLISRELLLDFSFSFQPVSLLIMGLLALFLWLLTSFILSFIQKKSLS